MTINEEWRPIAGYEGKYEVSSLGNVRSLRFVNGHVDRPRATPLVLARVVVSTGYQQVDLCLNGKIARHDVHVLVLSAFAGPRPAGLVAAHLNGIRHDSRACNLIWATRRENESHKVGHGTRLRGESNPHARLTEDQVREIRRRYDAGARPIDLSREFGIQYAHTINVARRRVWRHLP